jgi:HlyD family secretion protein
MKLLRLLTNGRVLATLAVIAGLMVVALWPTSVPVDLISLTRGPLLVTVDEEGMTRVRDRFVVSAPVAGRVLRIELEPGDHVQRGHVVARVRAEAPPLLDARTSAEAHAAVESSRAALGRARAEEQRTKATFAQARRELARARDLDREGLTTKQEVEAREAEVRVAEESVSAATFAVGVASSELQRAEARLAPSVPDKETPGRVVDVSSPVDGLVLKRVRESESIVPAGDPLLEIGDSSRLEIVADLLSTDAVRAKPGARAIIEQWGGDKTLEARVRRVEPSGFTKISALGVEEQRVNVVLDFLDPAAAWAALGDAYRVEVRIVIWEGHDVLKVPTSALFREGDQWAVFLVGSDGRARRTVIEVGHQTGQEAEVLSGLSEGARVILHPGDTVVDGARVRPRSL